jgi:hypothetical protein
MLSFVAALGTIWWTSQQIDSARGIASYSNGVGIIGRILAVIDFVARISSRVQPALFVITSVVFLLWIYQAAQIKNICKGSLGSSGGRQRMPTEDPALSWILLVACVALGGAVTALRLSGANDLDLRIMSILFNGGCAPLCLSIASLTRFVSEVQFAAVKS